MCGIRSAVLFLLLSLSGWAAGPQRPAAPQKSAPAKTANAKAGAPALSDAQVEAKIRARFADSKIAVNKFEVKVQGGVATITGRTDIVQHKGTATRLAKTAGAVAVRNRVEVSEKARAKAAANLEQARRRVQVKRGESSSQGR